MEIWKADPTFTNFVPKTAVEAVDRFTRCQRNGLRPMLVPECLISCAKGLDEAQLDLFEAWIINPNGSLDGVKLVEQTEICAANDKIFEENAARIERNCSHWSKNLPLVPDVDDEKKEPTGLPPMPRMRRQVSSDYVRPESPPPSDQSSEALETPPEASSASLSLLS